MTLSSIFDLLCTSLYSNGCLLDFWCGLGKLATELLDFGLQFKTLFSFLTVLLEEAVMSVEDAAHQVDLLFKARLELF